MKNFAMDTELEVSNNKENNIVAKISIFPPTNIKSLSH